MIVREGERRAGDGTGAAKDSLGKEWNEGVKSKDRVTCLNGTAVCQYVIVHVLQVTELKYLGSTLQRNEVINIQ